MRIIKMAAEQVAEDGGLHSFFRSLGERDPLGLFLLPEGRLGAGSMYPGEPLLFSMEAAIQYVARSTSGRQDNPYPETREQYAHSFTMDPYSVRRVYVPFDAIKHRLKHAAAKTLDDTDVNVYSPGWNAIADTDATAALFAELVREGLPI